MDIRTIVLILLRRWYVAVPIAALTLYVASGSGGSPTHSIEASFLLVTQPVGTADEELLDNPILNTPSAVNAAANVAVVIMHSENRRMEVADAGYASGYGFAVARNDPFVTLEISHASADLTAESAVVLSQLFVEEVAQQQLRFGADAGALIRAELLEISEPIADYSGVRTTQLTRVVMGFLLAFLAAFAVEGIAYFFSDRRKEFAELDRYERDAAVYGVGGESAADHNPSRPAPIPVRAATEQPELERKTSTRWVRRRAQGDE